MSPGLHSSEGPGTTVLPLPAPGSTLEVHRSEFSLLVTRLLQGHSPGLGPPLLQDDLILILTLIPSAKTHPLRCHSEVWGGP